MSFRFPTRRLIALAAAYLVAAQAVLLPLSVAAASPLLDALCVSSSSGGGHGSTGSDKGCGCAAGCGIQCCAPAHLASPPVEFRPPPVVARILTPALAFGDPVRSAGRSAHHPRAPPSA